MKRLALLTLLIASAVPAFAFNPSAGRPGRIGILAIDGSTPQDGGAMIRSYLLAELKRRGFDAFNANYTYDDLVDDDNPSEADVYVLLIGQNGEKAQGGLAIGLPNAGVDLTVIKNVNSCFVRLYDGRTLREIDAFEVSKNSTAVLPTAIGVGGVEGAALWFALPFIQNVRVRSAAKSVAADTADVIVHVSRDEARLV